MKIYLFSLESISLPVLYALNLKKLLNLNLIYIKMQLITGYFLFLSDFCFVGKKRDKVDWNVSIVSKLS